MFLYFVTAFIAFAHAEEANDIKLPEISVFGAAKSSAEEFVPTVGELSGQRLQRKRQSTVGETLARETGVTSSQFGPNASRPIIRGQDGDRIRVLQNGVGVLDASAASPDHAVAVEPLVVERFEIVRGPAALLYGSSAVGGVVNMVTNRIPEKLPQGFTGRADVRGSSTDGGRAGGFTFETPVGSNWALHADAAVRAADDYHVPGFARTQEERDAEPLDPEAKGRVYNTFNRGATQAVGASYIFAKGFVGTSFSNYESVYGSPPEREVHINLLQQRWDVNGEYRPEGGWIHSIRAKNSYSHYRHNEMEGPELGTTFKNDGNEARVELRHRPTAGYTGVIGAQANTFVFSAKGEESYLPPTDNQTYSAFIFEERESGTFRPSFGARFDSSSVKSKDDATFGPGEKKSFSGASVSLGALYQIQPTLALTLNGAYTERAPNYQELFANGPHAATNLIERGDKTLRNEKAHSLEVSLRKKTESLKNSFTLFLQDFDDYIFLSPTGLPQDPTTNLDIYAYGKTDARLYGVEWEISKDLGTIIPGGQLAVEFKLDSLRGIDRRTGHALPRITPNRQSISLVYSANAFQADVELQRSGKQTDTAPGETETGEYMLLNLGVEAPIRTETVTFSTYARVNNVLDREARNHVSWKKNVAPLPGRNFILGMQASF